MTEAVDTYPLRGRQGHRFRRLLGLVFSALVLVNIGFAVAVYLLEPRGVFEDVLAAESFMGFIEQGNGEIEGGEVTGFEMAYDLLLPSCRQDVPFEEFLFFFDEQVRNYGFVQSWRRAKREYGHFGARRLRFAVEYGGLGAPSTVVIYEFVMGEEDGRFGVVAYDLISRSRKEH